MTDPADQEDQADQETDSMAPPKNNKGGSKHPRVALPVALPYRPAHAPPTQNTEQRSTTSVGADGKDGEGGKDGTQQTKGQSPFGPGLGYDPARGGGGDDKDGRARPDLTPTEQVNKRMDLPADAFKLGAEGVVTKFAQRPGFNSEGRAIKLKINLFPVTEFSRADVYQYDVQVSPDPHDSHSLVKKVWASPVLQAQLRSAGGSWLYDSGRIAWSTEKIPLGEFRLLVDLDAGGGTASAPGKTTGYTCHVRQSTTVRMECLRAYLDGTIGWDTPVLACMNLLDHVMRQGPSERMIAIKRSFYGRTADRHRLEQYVEVRKGTYSSFKMSQRSKNSIHLGLTINSDVANTAFWRPMSVVEMALRLVPAAPAGGNQNGGLIDMRDLVRQLRPVCAENHNLPGGGPGAGGNGPAYRKSPSFILLNRLQKVSFRVEHHGRRDNGKVYRIKSFLFDQKYRAPGGTANTHKFQKRSSDGTVQPEINVERHYRTFGGRLQYPDLPLVETSRDGCFPMEVCIISEFQKFNYKLDPRQTTQMLRIAVTRPEERKDEILRGVSQLDWAEDAHLRNFGVKISPEMVTSEARLLAAPDVNFAGANINPRQTGHWDLRNKRFLEANPHALVSWAFIGVGDRGGNCAQREHIQHFADAFTRAYRGHGGAISVPPWVAAFPHDPATSSPADIALRAWRETGSKFQTAPQIIFFIVPNKAAPLYEGIKKSMDCRFAQVSQVLVADHVRSCSPQYLSNVAMKVNCKLGGATCSVSPMRSRNGPKVADYFERPTMLIGLDVTHAGASGLTPSVAAMTVSMDRNATKWAGACETNGYRLEIVTASNLSQMLSPLVDRWVTLHKKIPAHVYYFRDGVSEGQFAHVLDEEVTELKRIMQRRLGGSTPKFTVIIATKRHHVRFFPTPGDAAAADRNGNTLPGTLVERDATHPGHFDFYLASHVALKGTARPVHYHVLLDEAKMKPNDLQRMIYHQCYAYARSTSPVSLHPAVYYAHLTAARGACHAQADAAQSGPRRDDDHAAAAATDAAAPALLPMGTAPDVPQDRINFMRSTMWFI